MPDEITLEELLNEAMESRSSQLNTMMPGKVQSWSSTNETADVIPLVIQPGGEEYPVIRAAKVVFPGVYWDLQVGETGLIIFGQWDFSRWWRSGQRQEAETVGDHPIHAATFLPGVRARGGGRSVPAGATVLPGNDVRLSGNTAAQYVLRGTAYTGHENTFLTAMSTWADAVLAGGPPLAAATTAFKAAIVVFQGQLNGDLSTKVKVD